MRDRLEEVDTSRPDVFAVEGAGRVFHFRYPPGSRFAVLAQWAEEYPAQGMARALAFAGGVLGACWSHELYELEAEWPASPTPEALAAYSEAVQLELQTGPLKLKPVHQLVLSNIVAEAARDTAAVKEEAAELAGFTLRRPAGTTS